MLKFSGLSYVVEVALVYCVYTNSFEGNRVFTQVTLLPT